jgi:patatin-related protein
MHEKELRLALVCYGGISLAVYMHGVTKEILKLVRAAKFYHDVRERALTQDLSYPDVNDDAQRETDTETVYFDLLKIIGHKLHLRVIVDVIAGSSAGGINGIALARALAHDLPLDAHRAMWLELADITELMDAKTIAGRWSKPYLQPLLWQINRGALQKIDSDHEVRSKVSTFLRSRWFRPPFSGERFSGMLLDAFELMEQPQQTPGNSLMPVDHQLDLFVTLTDFYGYSQSIALYDPPLIDEREHRHVLRFCYQQRRDGQVISELDRAHIPALAFAARATSSYAGAFPPVKISEIETVLAARGQSWPERKAFTLKQFRMIYESGADPLQTSFIDGGVLNNKPFAQAIRALSGRPAHREVERFLLYLEPCPESSLPLSTATPPGYFLTMRSALSDLLRNQPIRDELEWLSNFAERKRHLKQIIQAARPRIAVLVSEIISADTNTLTACAELPRWRAIAKLRAAHNAGFIYEGYVQLRILSVLDSLAGIFAAICRRGYDRHEHTALRHALEQWAAQQNLFEQTPHYFTDDAETFNNIHWARFFTCFDVDFRIRQLRFVIRRLNELYRHPAAAAADDDHHQQQTASANPALSEFKAALYEALNSLLHRLEGDCYGNALRNQVALLAVGPAATIPAAIDELLPQIAAGMDLETQDRHIDSLFDLPCWQQLDESSRRELLYAYLGFSFFDVLTLTVAQLRDLDEFDEVKVLRLSADDAVAIRSGGARATLKGTTFGYFGGFFSRRYRENDYLWGRLHSADRLVDVVMRAAFARDETHSIDVAAIKRRLFRVILEAEGTHLQRIDDIMAEISREIDRQAG